MAKKATNKTKEETFSKADVEQLIGELTADIQRIQAEFINYKRRAEEEKLQAIQVGKQQTITAILPVLDNIERAMAHAPEDIGEHQWVKGVNSVASQLNSQLESIGLVKFGQPGNMFNPELFEAVAVDDTEGDEEVVSDVIQPGYQFNDQIIRHAMVKVTKKQSP